ncbi:hypothetical protein HY333_00190 [Candidatus Collierbacteria bacterium]|nr:hypothetical protein [Candidatus Collierbacteria bacterium]
MNTALKNIRRSPYQALAAILVTSLTVFVIAVFTLVSLASDRILSNFETRPQVIAYLKDGHEISEVNLLINNLSSNAKVKKAVYVSKEEALKIYKDSVGNDPLLLGSVTDLGLITAEILPASIEITALQPSAFPQIVSLLEQSELVSFTPQGKKEIDFPQDVISELTSWTKAIRLAGLVLIVILTLTSVFTLMVIISMKISQRRLEINTMKLLGAQNFFIIKPYLIESVLYGVTGALIGWLSAYISLLYSTPFLAQRLIGIVSFPLPLTLILSLFAGLAVFASLLGFVSGLLATVRFLNR